MSFTVMLNSQPKLTGTGGDTYAVGTAGQLQIDQGGVRTIYPAGQWLRVIDTAPA